MLRTMMIALAGVWLSLGSASAQDTCSNRGQLDDLYCDANGDLVADLPTDPTKLKDPSTLVFAYTPIEDPAIYANLLKPFITHLNTCIGRRVMYFSVQSNTAQIEAMRSGRLHIAGCSNSIAFSEIILGIRLFLNSLIVGGGGFFKLFGRVVSITNGGHRLVFRLFDTQSQRFLKVCHGFVGFVSVGVHLTSTEISIRIFGLHGNGTVVCLNGLLVFFQLVQRNPQVEQCVKLVWIGF